MRDRILREERFYCPKCGGVISKGDMFCKFCGADLSGVKFVASESGAPASVVPAYERRFGFFARVYRLVVSPSEAMQDIALAPDYAGVFAVLFAEFILLGVSFAVVFSKFQLVGPYASEVGSFIATVLVIAGFLAFGLVIVRWLIKSAIVFAAANSGSNWSFKVAAVVTGYAYFADVVVMFVGVFVAWLAIPSLVFDTSSLAAAQQSVASWEADITWLRFVYTLPLTFLGVLWKSYLGGLGSHHGTGKLCSVGKGFAVFFLLGLIGILLSLIA